MSYPSDLTDAQWAVLEPLLLLVLPRCRRGRRSMKGWRHSLNALLYLVKTGCQWRFLPKEYGNWKTTYSVFWRWRRAGVWKRLSDGLRERLRLQMNREAQPSVAIIDSQSVKTVQKGRQRGYDAGKKIKGRKRHIAVDTLGLLLVVVVHSAGIQDRVGARAVLAALYRDTTRLVKVFADSLRLAPGGKCNGGLRVGLSGPRVADMDGEEFDRPSCCPAIRGIERR